MSYFAAKHKQYENHVANNLELFVEDSLPNDIEKRYSQTCV